MRYRAKISYLGSAFCGFQVQPRQRTVQGELTKALSRLFASPVKVTGCSRTDSGVHALDYVILIETEDTAPFIPPLTLPQACLPFLPPDLSLMEAIEATSDFHPRYQAVEKEYVYRIDNGRVPNPMHYQRAWFYSRKIDEERLARMQKASAYLLGEHDFTSFRTFDNNAINSVRTITYCHWERDGDTLQFTIRGNGFLYHMVRIIVGTMLDVAFDRIAFEDIPDILRAKDRTKAGQTAPPEGLYLHKVKYLDDEKAL